MSKLPSVQKKRKMRAKNKTRKKERIMKKAYKAASLAALDDTVQERLAERRDEMYEMTKQLLKESILFSTSNRKHSKSELFKFAYGGCIEATKKVDWARADQDLAEAIETPEDVSLVEEFLFDPPQQEYEEPKKYHKHTDFVPGDKVYLLSGHYHPAPNNPCIGSEYECVGTIVENQGAISVAWSNGTRNGYTSGHLIFDYEHTAKDCKSIW